jgi:hypothetical protein
VLDPIRTDSLAPVPLETYIPQDFAGNTWYIRMPGYRVSQSLTHDELVAILPFFSVEIQHILREFFIGEAS